ncbi:hypothetical protein [Limnoglobus roseus]|uniref:Uncharacterized protein n=1 Tax=Limnoglobus roseus TaxID=2598579 RepID=A0A5C1AE62_9BACT|nr:hypothetical protein [Limnoglobus roseus]QEL16865.1 hypothetical protein PX52LOC_03839 [Limnoglobus roseus]
MSDTFWDLRFDSPVRPPDWRPRLAAALHQARLAFVATRKPDVPDALVRKLLTTQYAWGWDAPTVDEWSAITAAERWQRTAASDDRLILQARLLAREADEQIGPRLGLPAVVVGFVEKLFFNCRDRLDCPAFVRNSLLGAPLRPTAESVLKSVAYFNGPDALDEAILAFAESRFVKVPSTPATVADHQTAVDWARRRCWWAAAMLSPFDLNLEALALVNEIGSKSGNTFSRLRLSDAAWSLHPNPQPSNQMRPELATPPEAETGPELRVHAAKRQGRKGRPKFDLSSDFSRSYDRLIAGHDQRDLALAYGRNKLCKKTKSEPIGGRSPASSGATDGPSASP